MHIALLCPVAPPAGGVQSHTAALRDRLRDAGHRASLVAITRGQPVDRDDVFYPQGAVELMSTLRRLRPDVVHLHFGGDLSVRLALLCAVIGSMPGFRSVLTFHSGGFPSSPRGRRARHVSVEGLALRRLDAVIAVNSEIADLFTRYGVRPGRLSTIAPYAKLDRSRIAAALPDGIAAFYAAHDPVFIAVGLLEPEYALDLQIASMPQLRQRWPDAGLMLIGSGSLEHALRQQIAESPVSRHIALQGNVDHPVTLRAIDEADILLRTTRFDGDAVSIREALQLHTSVVASNTGMRPDGVHLMTSLDTNALEESCARALETANGNDPRRATSTAPDDELNRVLRLYESLVSSQ